MFAACVCLSASRALCTKQNTQHETYTYALCIVLHFGQRRIFGHTQSITPQDAASVFCLEFTRLLCAAYYLRHAQIGGVRTEGSALITLRPCTLTQSGRERRGRQQNDVIHIVRPTYSSLHVLNRLAAGRPRPAHRQNIVMYRVWRAIMQLHFVRAALCTLNAFAPLEMR